MTTEKNAEFYKKYKSKMLEKIICKDCNKMICRSSKSKHLKSKYHLDYIKKYNNDENNLEKKILNYIDELINTKMK